VVLNLKQLFEEATDDRMVAVYSAWMIAAMQEPETACPGAACSIS
jgi:hypothetical protein